MEEVKTKKRKSSSSSTAARKKHKSVKKATFSSNDVKAEFKSYKPTLSKPVISTDITNWNVTADDVPVLVGSYASVSNCINQFEFGQDDSISLTVKDAKVHAKSHPTIGIFSGSSEQQFRMLPMEVTYSEPFPEGNFGKTVRLFDGKDGPAGYANTQLQMTFGGKRLPGEELDLKQDPEGRGFVWNQNMTYIGKLCNWMLEESKATHKKFANNLSIIHDENPNWKPPHVLANPKGRDDQFHPGNTALYLRHKAFRSSKNIKQEIRDQYRSSLFVQDGFDEGFVPNPIKVMRIYKDPKTGEFSKVTLKPMESAIQRGDVVSLDFRVRLKHTNSKAYFVVDIQNVLILYRPDIVGSFVSRSDRSYDVQLDLLNAKIRKSNQ